MSIVDWTKTVMKTILGPADSSKQDKPRGIRLMIQRHHGMIITLTLLFKLTRLAVLGLCCFGPQQRPRIDAQEIARHLLLEPTAEEYRP